TAGRAPVPGLDGEAGAGARRLCRRRVRRRRGPPLERVRRPRRPPGTTRRASRLRRHEGSRDARGPLQAVPRRECGRAGSSDTRRGRLAAGPPRLPGGEARAQGRAEGGSIELRTLTDGGQPADETARALADFVGAARRTLDIAIYDIRLPDPLATVVK